MEREKVSQLQSKNNMLQKTISGNEKEKKELENRINELKKLNAKSNVAYYEEEAENFKNLYEKSKLKIDALAEDKEKYLLNNLFLTF